MSMPAAPGDIPKTPDGPGTGSAILSVLQNTVTAINGLSVAVKNKIKNTPVSVKDYGAKGNGTTDDTAAIKSAISSIVSSSGGALYFPAGTYLISATLAVPSLTHVTGDGSVSIIKGASGFPDYPPFFTATGVNGKFLLTNNDYVNGNVNILIDNIAFDFSNDATVGGTHCVHLRKVSYTLVESCTFFKGNDGVALTASSFYSVKGCFATAHSNACIDQFDGCTDGSIIGNIVDGQNVASSYGILCTGVATSGGANTSKRVLIAGNTVKNVNLTGIWIQGGAAGSVQDCLVEGNTIDTCDLGIRISEAQRIDVVGNSITNTQHQAIASAAEAVSAGASCLVGLNSINGASLAGAGAASAIDLQNTSTKTVVTGNNINGTNHNFAINIGAGASSILVSENICTVGTAGAITNSGTAAVIVNNPGYNPVGVSVAANVGASPATVTAGASPETHYLNQSATSTATIAKGGRQIAALVNASTFYVVELGPNEAYVVTWVTTQPTFTKDIH